MNHYKIFFLLAVVLLASCKSPFEKIDPSESVVVRDNYGDAAHYFYSDVDYNYPSDANYEMGDAIVSSPVNSLEVDWVFGSVKVAYYDGKEVRCTEQNDNPTEITRMRYWLDDTTLRIRFSKSGQYEMRLKQKDLTILLPNLSKPNLRINTASASVSIEGISSKEINVDASSGDIVLENVKASSLDLRNISGDITLTNVTANRLDMETSSGDEKMSGCNFKITNLESISGEVLLSESGCSSLNMETSSGNVETNNIQCETCKVESVSGDISMNGTVKHNTELETSSGNVFLCGLKSGSCSVETVSGDVSLYGSEKNLEVSFKTVSGEFDSSIPFTKNGDVYKMGNGGVKIDVETASGDMNVIKPKKF